MTYYENKTVLITGGSSGIGLAAAHQLAAQGAHVWLLARRREPLEAALASVKTARQSQQQRFGLAVADVSDDQQVHQAVDQVISEAGLPDVVINSAGIAKPGYVQELDLEIFHRMMEVNYYGTVHVTKAVLPGMIARRSGHIINVSSVAGFLGTFGYSAYGASKYAVRGFSDVLRSEMNLHGIRVSIIFPTDTQTPQLEYEIQFRPPEIKAITNNFKAMKPEEAARIMLKEAARGRYIILPGLDTKLIYWGLNLVGNGIYPIMDLLINLYRPQHHPKH